MKKQPIDQSLHAEALERLHLNQTEEEIQQLLESDLVPSQSELQKYNQLMPNGAERILTIIEEEKKHQRSMEKSKQQVRNVTKILSIFFGFLLTVLMFFSTMRFGVTRFEFILLWAVTLVLLGVIFASFIKENLSGGRERRDY